MKENKPSSSRRTTGKTAKTSPVVKKSKGLKAGAPAAQSPDKPKAAEKPLPQAPVPLKVPPILLENDQTTPTAPVSGPGQRYALGPTPPPEHFEPIEGELPESYGTMQLFLTARDPHWLYAAWDLSSDQIRKYNSLSVDRHMVLRIYIDNFLGEAITQIHLHPESRNWFVPVPHASTKYCAELGYYGLTSEWSGISKSAATLTPPDSVAEDTSVRFATLTPDIAFSELIGVVKAAMREHVPLVEALQLLRAEGFTQLPGPEEAVAEKWTPAQEQALAQVVSMDQIRRVWIGSLEITELIRRQLERQVSSQISSFALVGQVPGSAFSAFSPFGKGEQRKGFWFNINAELIIYGATEPDARVTIGERQIRLRPDGTFSFRFALPDGEYSLPAVAVSADGDDSRGAALQFSRDTQFEGEVGKHPQDAALKPPVTESVA